MKTGTVTGDKYGFVRLMPLAHAEPVAVVRHKLPPLWYGCGRVRALEGAERAGD
jgi:hypothetical protein